MPVHKYLILSALSLIMGLFMGTASIEGQAKACHTSLDCGVLQTVFTPPTFTICGGGPYYTLYADATAQIANTATTATADWYKARVDIRTLGPTSLTGNTNEDYESKAGCWSTCSDSPNNVFAFCTDPGCSAQSHYTYTAYLYLWTDQIIGGGPPKTYNSQRISTSVSTLCP